MIEAARSGALGAWARIAVVATAGMLALPGCSSNKTPSQEPTPVKLAQAKKVAVIRLGNPAIEEPSDADIAAGIRFGGIDGSSFAVADRDAKGDLAAVPGLIDAAVSDGADLLLTLLPETTSAAAGKGLKVPLIFQMTGEPIAMGLGKSDSEHSPNLTGAYTPFGGSLMVPIAQGCLRKVRKLGIPFNPDDRYSVIHKDALLRTNWGQIEPKTAEFHSASDVPAAVRALVEQKAEGIILVTGIGEAAGAAIAEARRAKVPVFGFLADHARAGAIVAREPRLRWGGFEAGRRAGRVLKGEPAGGISFVQGVDYVTYVNTGAAKDLGVKILGDLMRDARVVSSESR